MPPSSPSPGRVHRFFKRAGHSVQEVFKPGDQTPSSRSPSLAPQVPLEDPPPQLIPSLELVPFSPPQPTPSLELVPVASPQPPAQLQQLQVLPQPAPSPSQPLLTSLPAADNNLPADATALAAKKARVNVWAALKASLGSLQMSSNVFPPLKSSVAGFLGVIDVFEAAAQNREDYAELASNIQGLIHEFSEHPGEYVSSKMSDALKAAADGLEKEMNHIQKQQQRSVTRRQVEGGQDSEDVRSSNRRVEALRRELRDKAQVNMWRNQEEQLVDTRLRELHAELKATYNSSKSTSIGRRGCTLGTREAILAGMREWANDPESPKVYWLNGMAGTGKTTLAYSFCAEMQHERRLGASFFCSRADADSRDVSKIVPTIAHQLGRLLPAYRSALIRQIGEDKDIAVRNIRMQFEKLIRDPLREVEAQVLEGIIVTIDALDECDSRDEAIDILNVLFLHATDLPIKFLVSCRPEPGLFDMLQSKDERLRYVRHLHDVEASFVQADITTFLEVELASISLPREKIWQLAEQAGTLFIYAAAAVRYIYPQNRPVNSLQRLEDFSSVASQTRSNKYRIIDDMYRSVLATPFTDDDLDDKERENIRLVLSTVVCAREPMSVATITKLLEMGNEEDTMHALGHLRSVLHVSQGVNLVSTLHASFPDFLFNDQRSGGLHCNATIHNQLLALCCFRMMRRSLRLNICDLESSFVFDQDIPNLTTRIEKAITSELSYACRYWGDHITFVETRDDVSPELCAFLSDRLLFWVEVLNLKNQIHQGVQILHRTCSWLQNTGGSTDLLELANDSVKFVISFGMSQASRSTPHIYISALTFWPPTRPVSRQYSKRTQGLLELEGRVMRQRDLSCLGMWDTASNVICVAFSPDGAQVVSGSSDHAVRIWNARSGLLVAELFRGHTHRVNSVAFSPDSALVASGSSDKTIRVCDARSGLLVAAPFNGHIGQVCCIAFSPDNAHVASGASDNTIRVWGARSGSLVAGPFEGHTESVKSVGFSPDGSLIVSGSSDCTIRVWDARSGHLVGAPLEGHTGQVCAVSFSPDGAHIASGSSDNTARVWDARSRLLVAGPLKGHTGQIRTVSFSPDSTRIASGSDDRTIRVWDARSGLLVAGPFEGHSGWVYSVVFSPDGTLVVSGSGDQNIRVWDARSASVVAQSFGGHIGSVYSVAFSPDGAYIVSGSHDRTIRIWDARSGLLVAGPLERHSGQVSCVAFSPDGTHVVSGSSDNTICVWDVRSRSLVAGPFEGHTDWVNSVMFSYDGTRIASGSSDNTIRVWDVRSGDLVVGPFEGHTDWVNSIAFSPDETCIVSGSRDGTVRTWDARSGLLIARSTEGNNSSVNSVSFSPNGAFIASGYDDCAIRVWDARSVLLVAGPLEGHTGQVCCVSYSPDSTRIVSGSSDGTIRVWDVHSGLLVAGPFEGHSGWVYSVVFSPDGTLVVSGSGDKNIRVWDTRSEPVLAESFGGRTGQAHSVASSLDDASMVSGSSDNAIDVRDTSSIHTHNSGHTKSWLMDKEGVVTTEQGQLLLCVPADVWSQIVRPQNIACICDRGALQLNFSDTAMGDQWFKRFHY